MLCVGITPYETAQQASRAVGYGFFKTIRKSNKKWSFLKENIPPEQFLAHPNQIKPHTALKVPNKNKNKKYALS